MTLCQGASRSKGAAGEGGTAHGACFFKVLQSDSVIRLFLFFFHSCTAAHFFFFPNAPQLETGHDSTL